MPKEMPKELFKTLGWALIIFLGLSLFFSIALQSPARENINLNDLAVKIQTGEVEKIEVRGEKLLIELKDGTKLVSRKEPNIAFSETIKNYGVPTESFQMVNLEIKEPGGLNFWMTLLLPAILPIILIAVLFLFIFKRASSGVNQAFTFGRANIHLFTNFKEKLTFKDVAGLKEAKEELKEIIEFLKTPKKFLDLGAKIPRGVLLMGPPGSGKTLLARAVAGEANVPFFHISASEFVEMFVGVGASRTRDAFSTAKKAAPSIIFIDEIDAIGRERGAGLGGGHDEREQTLNQILVEMDGFDRDTNVIVLAASVTGDTPVLVKKNNEIFLRPIAEIINNYYQSDEEGGEKETSDLEVLGFEGKPNKQGVYFKKAAFKKVKSVFRHKVEEIYEIDYLGGKIKATGNHSIFIRDKWGVRAKPVCQLKIGEILADLPYQVNRTNKNKREIRTFDFNKDFNLELPVWFPLFEKSKPIDFAYQYALANIGQISQTQLGCQLGFSQRTIGKWQQGVCGPRELSRNYYQHQLVLPEKILVTPGLLRLFGYYVAEGYSRKELDFCFNLKEKEKIDDVKNLIKEIFNLESDRERNTTPNALNIIYHSKPLAEFFAYYCGRGAYQKHIPSFLFNAPKEYFIEFFRGYFSGDGHKDKNGRLEVTSVSKRLILELNWLARLHGFKSYIHSFTAKKGRVINNGKPLKATVAWRLGFGKTQNPLEKIEGKANVRRPIVKSVKRLPYDNYVYDFCGCENEAFFGGESPILLHNTNRPDVLDHALLRPGRFDRRIILEPPDINEREEILKIHSKNKPLDQDVDLKKISTRTPGFSGADLANLINEAAILAARKNKKMVNQQDIYDSIEKVLLGSERKTKIISEKEKKIISFHEAGHALTVASLKDSDPVHKVSIISRGRVGGYTLKLPIEEQRLKTKSQFLADLTALLGGYVAEKETFKEVSTGASHDLKQVSELARSLVTRFGMSEKFGPIAFGKSEELIFLGREIATEKNYSEKIAAEIDAEVKKIIDQVYKTTQKIIISNKLALEKIAEELLKKEVLEQEDFYNLLKPFKLKLIKF